MVFYSKKKGHPMLYFRLSFMIFTFSIFSIAQSNDLGLNIGLNSIKNSDKIQLKNKRIGLSYQHNNIQFPIKPRIDIEYVDVSDYSSGSVSALVKGSLNMVYQIDASEHLNPYIIGGVGYESVDGAIEGIFESQPFIQGGVGLSYRFDNDMKVNLEAKSLRVLTGDNQADEVIVSLGLSIPLDAPTIDPNTCPKKIAGADEDRDGITDAEDICPNTPCGYTINAQGCPIKATLQINFAVNSANITVYSMPKVERFAKFLNNNTNAHVLIEGHTDSDGSNASNQILSRKRAQSVVTSLVALGVDTRRLRAKGYGETHPISSNATKAGKQQNRRIIAKISYTNVQ